MLVCHSHWVCLWRPGSRRLVLMVYVCLRFPENMATHVPHFRGVLFHALAAALHLTGVYCQIGHHLNLRNLPSCFLFLVIATPNWFGLFWIEQLIKILLKLKYFPVQYPDCGSSNFLIEANVWQNSTIMNYYGGAEIKMKSSATGGDSAFVIGYVETCRPSSQSEQLLNFVSISGAYSRLIVCLFASVINVIFQGLLVPRRQHTCSVWIQDVGFAPPPCFCYYKHICLYWHWHNSLQSVLWVTRTLFLL